MLFKTTHTLALAAACLSLGCATTPSHDDLRETEADTSRHDIVGGTTTAAFPAAGALTLHGGMHCTGTLIAPRRVLTAAHCLTGVSASAMRFVIGSSLAAVEASVGVVSVTPHPAYDAQQLTDDIGYVTLAADAPVAPMKMLPSMDASWQGRQLTFVGYGNSNGNGSGSGVKRSVSMGLAQIMPKQFMVQTPGKNTCNGDSGGPAFAKVGSEWFVAGVTSYGDAFCQHYGVDTRVDTYLAFLTGGGAAPGNDPGSPGSNAPSDPCHGESFAGRCDGSEVIWCENQTVYAKNCAAEGRACGFSAEDGYYACVQSDPCQGESYAGRCDGTSVIWCENDEVKQLSCNACGFDGTKNIYNCL